MIEINLLPVSLREKRKRVELPPTTFLLVGGGVLTLLLLACLVFATSTHLKRRNLQKAEEQLRSLQPESDRIAQLKKEKQKLGKKMAIIEQLVDNRVLWARKLNELSNIIPRQVWITSIFVEERSLGKSSSEEKAKREKFLAIKGIAISKGKEETGELKLVGDFMDRIRNDSSFCADFLSVEQCGSIRRDRMGGSEIMHFELSCQFNEGK
ncbi:hypothetical protein KAU86_04125 [bacterium]|nr:hypothetical protein [bacterium]